MAGIAAIYKVSLEGEAKLIGTGFWITETGHLITAWHVIEDNIGEDGVDRGPIYAMQALGSGTAIPRVLRKSDKHKIFDLALTETQVVGGTHAYPTRPLPMVPAFSLASGIRGSTTRCITTPTSSPTTAAFP